MKYQSFPEYCYAFVYFILGDYLLEFVKLCRRRESTDQLLPKAALTPTQEEGKNKM